MVPTVAITDAPEVPVTGIFPGDCRTQLERVPARTVSACVTDPPYDLTGNSRNGSPRKNDPATPYGRTRLGERGFMNQTWDGTGVAFDPTTWTAVRRTLRPGAPVITFAASRTWHKVAQAMIDAGFEISATSAWITGTGFPKSVDVAEAMTRRGLDGDPWTGWGTALKPAHEPLILAWVPEPGLTPPSVPPFFYAAKAAPYERVVIDGVSHPTVKPLPLIKSLVQTVLGPDPLILDPFLGSGTTAEVCESLGVPWIGCEISDGTNGAPNYLPLIDARIDRVRNGTSPLNPNYERNLASLQRRAAIGDTGQTTIFDV